MDDTVICGNVVPMQSEQFAHFATESQACSGLCALVIHDLDEEQQVHGICFADKGIRGVRLVFVKHNAPRSPFYLLPCGQIRMQHFDHVGLLSLCGRNQGSDYIYYNTYLHKMQINTKSPPEPQVWYEGMENSWREIYLVKYFSFRLS